MIEGWRWRLMLFHLQEDWNCLAVAIALKTKDHQWREILLLLRSQWREIFTPLLIAWSSYSWRWRFTPFIKCTRVLAITMSTLRGVTTAISISLITATPWASRQISHVHGAARILQISVFRICWRLKTHVFSFAWRVNPLNPSDWTVGEDSHLWVEVKYFVTIGLHKPQLLSKLIEFVYKYFAYA